MRRHDLQIFCKYSLCFSRGIVSEAMVMCASTPDKVEILAPPPGCKPGDRVTVEGVTSNPDPVLNPKKKVNNGGNNVSGLLSSRCV